MFLHRLPGGPGPKSDESG